jgi:shikimate kinase
MNIIITGMKHCGKSVHGNALAEHLKCRFCDTDDMLASLYRGQTGKRLSPREIFRAEGESFFRNLEVEVVKQLASGDNGGDENSVIALGGGLPANGAAIPWLEKLGFFVYLKVSPEIIFKRIMAKGLPPFLNPEKPYESFNELYKQREQYYLRLANLVIEIDHEMPLKAADKLIIDRIEEALNERQHIR